MVLSRILQVNLREYLFHALRCIRAKRRAGASGDSGPFASELPTAQKGIFLVHAGVGLTVLGGVATPDSAAPSSCCCFLRFRDKCSGPAQMTTPIAATIINPQ